MNLPTYIYSRLFASKGVGRSFFRLIRRWAIRLLNDPPCRMTVHGRTLYMPLSHDLPVYTNSFPFYDTLPERLGEFIRRTQGALVCIDVGANIGDTMSAFKIQGTDRYLGIEGDPKFVRYFDLNRQGQSRVELVNGLCSDRESENRYQISEARGTASFTSVDSGSAMKTVTIDGLVGAREDFKACNLIKTDTDGHDFAVMRGAREVVARNKPAILLECAPFSNERYTQDCMELWAFLQKVGYKDYLVYDNAGYLLDMAAMADTIRLANLLVYQMTGNRLYYDMLFLPAGFAREFHALEADYFLHSIDNKTNTINVRDAIPFALA